MLLHRGVEPTVWSRGHIAGLMVARVMLVVIGRHERATPDTTAAAIGSKSTATAAATAIHLAKLASLLGLLELSFSIMHGDVNARSARHGDGAVAFLGQVGDRFCTTFVRHADESEAATGSCVAIQDQPNRLYLSVRSEEGVQIGLPDLVAYT